MGIVEKQIRYSASDIANAISLAFTNGDKEKATKYYEKVKKAILRTKIHVCNTNIPFDLDLKKDYTNKLLEKCNYIDKKYNTSITKNMNLLSQNKYVYRPSSTRFPDEFNSIYVKHEKLFITSLISKDEAFNIYKKGKETFNLFISELRNFLKEINSIQEQPENDYQQAQLLSPKLEELSYKYKLYSYSDILQFYNELTAFVTDISPLEGDLLKMVTSYKEKAMKREGLNNLSKEDILKTIKSLKSILANPVFKSLLENQHIKDYFNDVKHTLSLEYLASISQILTEVNQANHGGATTINNQYISCIFKNSIYSLSSRVQNNMIIHELIHSYTLSNSSLEDSLMVYQNYQNIDELITEYLARTSINYLEQDILNMPRHTHIFSSMGYPHFELTMKSLINTPLMNTLIDIKINNDYKNLEKRIGKETLSLLNNHLKDPYNKDKFNKLMIKINNIK